MWRLMLASVVVLFLAVVNCSFPFDNSYLFPSEHHVNIASSSLFSEIKQQKAVVREKRSLIEYRNRRIMEIGEMTASYREIQDMISVEERFGTLTSLNLRKTKLNNLANLINILMEEVEMIDMYCEKRVGPNCDIPTCFGKYHQGISCREPCNGMGICQDVDTCVCKLGFHGSECQMFECFGIISNETSVCSNHGKCVSLDLCKCNNGFRGLNCEEEVPTSGVLTKDSNGVLELISPQSYLPRSCAEYFRNFYTINMVNGLYKINPYLYKRSPVIVYCDMEEGGYMRLDEELLKSQHIEHIMKSVRDVKTSYGSKCSIPSNVENVFNDKLLVSLCQAINKRQSFRHKYLGDFRKSPFKYWIK